MTGPHRQPERLTRRAIALWIPRVARRVPWGRRWLTPARLEAQLDRLARLGARWLTLDAFAAQALSGARERAGGVLVTVDAPTADFTELVWPVLAARGIAPVIFVASGLVGRTARRGLRSVRSASQHLGWTELRALAAQGASVQCLGHCGADLTRLPTEISFGDLMRSRREVEKRLGVEPFALAYPHGGTNPAVVELAALAGFTLGFVRGERVPHGLEDAAHAPLLLPRRYIVGSELPEAAGRKVAAG